MKHNRYTGLTDAQVLENRAKYGANILTPPEKEPLWKQFLDKFRDPLIIILMIAGVLSVGISCYEYYGLGETAAVFFEPVGIFIAILLATGLAFIFEYKADKEFSILNQVNDDEPVDVIRNGHATRIAKKDVVVGDILLIETGQEIPADAQLLDAVMLHVDESTLTGEPVCNKTINEAEFDSEATFPSNHVMRGTKVMEGHGVCKVFAVGDKTENGKVFEAAQIDDSVKTPLNEQLDRLGKLVSYASYTIAAVIVVVKLACLALGIYELPNADLSHVIAYILQTFMIVVTLIVVAVPEGLPMAVSLALAYSMRRMLKTNNLVRKMHACETMGATTIICTDKTGTLTLNQMRIYETQFYGLEQQGDVTGSQKLGDDALSRLIVEGIAVNSTAQLDRSDPAHATVLGNPTEGALLLWLDEHGIDYLDVKDSVKLLAEVPFSTERKYMATLVKNASGKTILYIKGAPEIVLALCNDVCGGVSNSDIQQQLLSYQQQAMRTLGFAYKVFDNEADAMRNGEVIIDGLSFLGIVAISDPVREDVPAAVKECLDAGIEVKIVTGDTPATAREIARQIGLWTETDDEDSIITGPEFAALTDEELAERVVRLKVIARARPMDKKRLVEALQKLNHVVAVTGDGTNDAPALKAAHVGLSMGDGTSVAKEASDITIIDNSFSSIGRAVMWGRSLYQNLQRFLLFQLTVNVAACLIVLVGAFMGTESPLSVTQMLWVNLIMDTFGAMALSSLPPAHQVMKDKPRDRKAFILDKSMISNILGVGMFFFVILLGFLYVFQHTDISQLTDLLHTDFTARHEVTEYERTLLFSIFVWCHFWYMFNARAYRSGGSGLNLKDCDGFLWIAGIIVVGQVLIVGFPIDFLEIKEWNFARFFNVVPMKLQDWVIIVVGSSLVMWVREAIHHFSTASESSR